MRQSTKDTLNLKKLHKMSSSMHEDLMQDILDNKEQEEPSDTHVLTCSIKSFTVKYMIGEGSYGKVYLVQHRDSGKLIKTNLFKKHYLFTIFEFN